MSKETKQSQQLEIATPVFGLVRNDSERGQTIIELLLVIGLTAIILPAILTGVLASRDGKVQQNQRLKAVAILKETQEAVRNVRENGWAAFAVNGTFNPEISVSSWILAIGSATINGFTRQVVISDVYRDANGAIVLTGGTLDPSTKKVVTTVSWAEPYASLIDSTMYLTRYLENEKYTDTTQNQTDLVLKYYPFNPGTKTGVTVRATTPPLLTDDGEIVLSQGGRSDWCEPTLVIAGLDLPGNGEATDITAVPQKAFVGTGQNASGMDFVNVSITDTLPPVDPVASNQGTYDANAKTNDVFGETIGATSYAYIATDKDGVTILNATSNPPVYITKVESSAQAVTVFNNTLYFTKGSILYAYNITNRASPSLYSSISIPASARKIIYANNHIFLALSSSSTQLKIIDVTNPSSMQSRGQLQVNSQSGQDLFVSTGGDRVYLVTSQNVSGPEFYIINTANKNSPAAVGGGTFDTGGMDPKGVTIVPGNRAIVVGFGGTEYQVIDFSNENGPFACGPGLDAPNNINDVSSVIETDGDVYSYIVTQTNVDEFRIISGGPGGTFASSGEFESATFDSGYSTANNRFVSTFNQPAGTTIEFQVSMANQVAGVCPSTGGYTFVGFDGNPATRSTLTSGVSATFPFVAIGNYINPGRCIRYKAYLSTTDNNTTPVLNDVTINYSP